MWPSHLSLLTSHPYERRDTTMTNFAHFRSHLGAHPEKFFKSTVFQGEGLLVGINCLEPGQSQPEHVHGDQDKFYYVVEGHGEFVVGEETRAAGTGMVVFAPAGVSHGVSNKGSAKLVLLVGISQDMGSSASTTTTRRQLMQTKRVRRSAKRAVRKAKKTVKRARKAVGRAKKKASKATKRAKQAAGRAKKKATKTVKRAKKAAKRARKAVKRGATKAKRTAKRAKKAAGRARKKASRTAKRTKRALGAARAKATKTAKRAGKAVKRVTKRR